MWHVDVADDSGFCGVVDPDAYDGFVDPQWSLQQLAAHVRRAMAARSLLLWGTGSSGMWRTTWRRADVVDTIGDVVGRRCSGGIVSSRGRLLPIAYENLTMVAQFKHVTLPEPYMAGDVLDVGAGAYAVHVHQRFDPARAVAAAGDVDFAVDLVPCPASAQPPAWRDVPWSSDL